MIDPWIVTESDEITARLLVALQRAEISCPSTRVISASTAAQVAADIRHEEAVVFFTADSLGAKQLELLRSISASLKAKLVVVSSVDRHETVLVAMRAGAHDFLSTNGDLEEQLLDLITRFRTAFAQRTTRGRMITVVPCQFGMDASVLAVSLAAAIAKRAGQCCLLDFHLRGGELALLMKLAPRHTIYDLITQRDGVDDAMFHQALMQHPSGVRLLAGPPLFSTFTSVQPQICQQLLSMAQASHHFAVVNAEDVVHVEQMDALSRSDDIVLTMRLDVVSVHRTQRHLEHLGRGHCVGGKLHVVAMWTGNSAELPVSAVKKVLNLSEIHLVPEDPVALTMSINTGNPLLLEAPQSKASQAIALFADHLLQLKGAGAPEAQRTANSSKASSLARQVFAFGK